MTNNIAILKSIKWPHLGYAFFWTTVFVGATPVSTDSGTNTFSGLTQLGVSILVVAVSAWALRDKTSIPPWHAVPGGIVLAFGVGVFYLTPSEGDATIPIAICASALTGASAGYFYIMWQQFFASEGEGHTSIYIPLSGILSVFLITATSIVPSLARMVLTVFVLPGMATYALWKSLGAVVAIRAESEPTHDAESTLLEIARTFSDLGPAILCCCVLGFFLEVCVIGTYRPG